MQFTIDTERNKIIVPNKYFEKVDAENTIIKNAGGRPVSIEARLTKAFEEALKDRIITKVEASTIKRKVSVVSDAANVPVKQDISKSK